MASYNRIVMMGNLTRDPELKQLGSGQGVCRFSLATNRQFKNKQTGTMVQEVCFIDVDVWGPQAESCNQYLQKGRSVLIEGRLKLDSWQDQDGNRRSKHSIVADRVTFVSSNAQAAEEGEFSGQNEAESFAESVVKPAASARPKRAARPAINEDNYDEQPSTGELNFKDEKPFSEDLPF